jgi:phosphate transport system substrate-binding protein
MRMRARLIANMFSGMGRHILALCLVAATAVCSTAIGGAALSVTGAGATFPYPMYSKWFDAYHKAHPDIEINYQSIGSGGGIRQVTAGTVDFGASDGPMTGVNPKNWTA